MSRRVSIIALSIILMVAVPFTAFSETIEFYSVPIFETGMNRLHSFLSETEPYYAQMLFEKKHTEEGWTDAQYGFSLTADYGEMEFTYEQKAGFVNSISISVKNESYENRKDLFIHFTRAMILALCPDCTEEDIATLLESLLWDYIVESPASSASQYSRYGVYSLLLSKSSSKLTFRMSLTTY